MKIFGFFPVNLKSNLRFKFLPLLTDKIMDFSIFRCEEMLKKSNCFSLLIDNTVLFHGVTHESGWVSTGDKMWGTTTINTGYLARIPVHSESYTGKEYNSIKYLPSIVSLAKRQLIELCLSDELRDEQLTQPMGRFSGYGIYDYSLFNDVDMRVIHDPDYVIKISPLDFKTPSIQEQRKHRLSSKNDCLYQDLLKVLGERNSQDIWHIVTAERNGCYCFLTMDFKLVNNLKAQKNNKIVKSLKTKVMTPEEFGKEFNLFPISPRLYSYHNASYPVKDELNWEDSKRQKPNKHT